MKWKMKSVSSLTWAVKVICVGLCHIFCWCFKQASKFLFLCAPLMLAGPDHNARARTLLISVGSDGAELKIGFLHMVLSERPIGCKCC
jgi:hypothetical protein